MMKPSNQAGQQFGSLRQTRRGITLLFVVSLIVLFLLMGTSFVLLAGQFRRSSVMTARVGTRIDDSRSLLFRAFKDLLREPSLDNVNSPLRGHSILGDQYGYGVLSRLRNPELVANTGAQIIRFELDIFSGPDPTVPTTDVPGENNQQFRRVLDGRIVRLSDATGSYDGQVLTFLRGKLSGVSARILKYEVEIDTTQNPQVVSRWFYVVLTRSMTSVKFVETPVANDVTSLEIQNTSPLTTLEFPNAVLADGLPDILINNRDFAGTGAGLFHGNPELARARVDVDEPALVAPNGSLPGAQPNTLFPNRRGQTLAQLVPGYLAATYGSTIPGTEQPNSLATNEEYDALDFQNMFLAGWVSQSAGAPQFVPSFHRPSLVRYHNGAAGPGFIDTTRADVFLANFAPIGGASRYVDVLPPGVPPGDGVPDNGYDVDTDGDGFKESIWIDIGLPIQTDTNGRRLRPLVAYMVLDMDGRLNVNAHANLTQPEFNADRFKATWQAFLHTGLPDFGATANAPGIPVSFGQGYGPPEVSLFPAFVAASAAAEVQALLRGATVAGTPILGRYGNDLIPGGAGRDLASAYKLFVNPDRDYPSRGLLGNGFSSTMDIHGRLALGVPDNYRSGLNVDPYDNAATVTVSLAHALPTIDITGSLLVNEIINSAYELDFGRAPFAASATGVDTPFSPRELESLLRRYDWDSAMLPPRLRLLLDNSFRSSTANIQSILTTDSFEVPVPAANLPARLRDMLLTIRYAPLPVPAVPTPADELFVRIQTELMLAPEVIQGRKMDLNFPLGNGLDDNGNGIVDEAAEQAVGEVRPDVYGRAAFGMDYDRTGTTGGSDFFARQIFARRLYMLTLLATQLIDRDGDGLLERFDFLGDWYDYNGSGGAVDINDLLDYRRDVAQWVANVIEFRDPDSIHSGYEFDLDPWDGWGLDGNIATNTDTSGTGAFPAEPTNDRFVVWGTERPELLLTEAAVTHDRRTQDTTNDPTGELAADEPGTQDLDSLFVPNASTFIELYNPWYRGVEVATGVNNTDVFPGELYGNVGVDLRRVSTTGADPVWRIVASRWNDSPVGAGAAAEEDLRFIYFVRPTSAALRTNARFPDPGQRIGQLRPGQYAVIGSSGVQNGADYNTYLGRRTTPTWDTELGDTRRITLRPGAGAVELRWFDDTANTWQTTTRNNLIVAAINRIEDGTAGGEVRSLGLTDPPIGYEAWAETINANADLVAVADGFKFQDSATVTDLTLDEPIDQTANQAASDNEWAQFDQFNDPLDLYPPNPAHSNGGIRDNSLHPGVRRLKLQRLANPLLVWNPEVGDPAHDPAEEVNPYITIDVLGADVATFNGASPDDETDATNPVDLVLSSFERSSNQNGPPATPTPEANNFVLLWPQDRQGRTENVDPSTATAAMVPFLYPAFTNPDMHYVSQNVVNSLGEPDLGYRQDPTVAGYSQRAYPWLTWNNRPYVSHLELVNVPFVGSGRLLEHFGLHNPAAGGEYLSDNTNAANNRLGGSFSHLPDFVADDYSRPNVVPAPPGPPGVPGLHRILDFVEVPSRFTATQMELNPLVFQNSNNLTGIKQYLNPPYSWVSNFREPGKINLNTLYGQAAAAGVPDDRIWRGLMGDYAAALPIWSNNAAVDTFDKARRTPPLAAEPTANRWPTDYPFVYRSAEKANFVPELVNTGLGSPPTDALVMSSAQTGLLRANTPWDPVNGEPLFDYEPVGFLPHFDSFRNAYFRYDQRQRLGNLTTQRSSVFAVWVTVGFFEVDELDRPVDEPDVSRRQRGFWLIDRSIPVAFEPGKDHNVERVILTSSIIE